MKQGDTGELDSDHHWTGDEFHRQVKLCEVISPDGMCGSETRKFFLSHPSRLEVWPPWLTSWSIKEQTENTEEGKCWASLPGSVKHAHKQDASTEKTKMKTRSAVWEGYMNFTEKCNKPPRSGDQQWEGKQTARTPFMDVQSTWLPKP